MMRVRNVQNVHYHGKEKYMIYGALWVERRKLLRRKWKFYLRLYWMDLEEITESFRLLSLFVILQTCFQSYQILTKLFANKIAKRFLSFITWRMAVRVLNPRNIYVAFANVITWSFLHCWVFKCQFLYTERFVRNTVCLV